MMRWSSGRAAGLGALALILALPSQPVAAPRARPLVTPEAAVEQFVNSVASDDFDGAMRAFAIDDRVAHSDFAKKARRLGAIMPTNFDAPSRYKMYVRINTLRALKDAANQTVYFAAVLLTDGSDPRVGKDWPDANTAAAILTMDMTKLKALKLVRIDQPHKSLTSTPKVLALFSEEAAAEGADALTERIVLLQLADQYYLCGFRLLKHGSTWGIQDLVSYFAFEDGQVSHGVRKITPEDFEAHTK